MVRGDESGLISVFFLIISNIILVLRNLFGREWYNVTD